MTPKLHDAHAHELDQLPLPLQTERLLLRDVQPEDWRDMHGYASDPEVVKYMTWGPNTEEQSRAHAAARSLAPVPGPRVSWELVLEHKSTRRVIGGCGIRIRSTVNRDADIGYVLHRDYWGQGLVTEAAIAIIEVGFSTLRMHRIWATTDPQNLRSIRVLERLGMRFEGRLREHLWCKQRWRDSALYSVLEHEWAARRAAAVVDRAPGA
jgi:[ribosomal protein S5]-alanine N-acetyltransferase